MEKVFGDACVYGSPQDVTGIVDRLSADPAALEAQRERGLRAVRERFSYEAHLNRLAAFAGGPTGRPAPAGGEQTGTSATLLVVPGTTASEQIAEAAAWVRDTLASLPVVCTEDHALGLDAAVESGPVTAQRVAHLARAHRAARVLVVDEEPAGASAADLVARLGVDTDAHVLRRDSAGSWGTATLERVRPEAAGGATAVVRRTAGRVVGGARRHMPAWARPAAKRVQMRAWSARRAAGPGPVSPVYTHIAPDAPVSLLVVTTADVDAGGTLDAVLAQAQITSRFRPALLAPRSWVAAASERGVFIDALIPVHQWDPGTAVRWTDYLEARLEDTVRRTGAAAVTVVDHTLVPGEPDPVLTVLTMAGRRS
jgi:hypothetical protein